MRPQMHIFLKMAELTLYYVRYAASFTVAFQNFDARVTLSASHLEMEKILLS